MQLATGGTAIISLLFPPLSLVPLFSFLLLSSSLFHCTFCLPRLVRVLLEQVVSSTIERCVETVLMEQSVRSLWLRRRCTWHHTQYHHWLPVCHTSLILRLFIRGALEWDKLHGVLTCTCDIMWYHTQYITDCSCLFTWETSFSYQLTVEEPSIPDTPRLYFLTKVLCSSFPGHSGILSHSCRTRQGLTEPLSLPSWVEKGALNQRNKTDLAECMI